MFIWNRKLFALPYNYVLYFLLLLFFFKNICDPISEDKKSIKSRFSLYKFKLEHIKKKFWLDPPNQNSISLGIGRRWWKILSWKFSRGRRRWRSWYEIIIIIITPAKKFVFFTKFVKSFFNFQVPDVRCFLQKITQTFIFPISTSLIKEPITGFCASKCLTTLSSNSIGFCFFYKIFEIGSSFPLKLASFNLLLAT